ncbi:MAG: RidA family protein [Gammaproteobacteria bacterium]|nr:RidA family protein [Gammaproteobacteria bacterium]
MTRNAVNAPGFTVAAPYSHAVEGGGLMFLSGQVPLDHSTGKLVTGSIGEQTAQCFKNLFLVLEAAGLSAGDVVSVQVFLTDMNDFADMNAVYAQQFTKPYPARTTIGVAALPLGARIEIALTAKTRWANAV